MPAGHSLCSPTLVQTAPGSAPGAPAIQSAHRSVQQSVPAGRDTRHAVLHRNRLALGLAAATLLAWALIGLPIHHQLAEHRDTQVLWKPRALKLKTAKAPKPSSTKPAHHHGVPATPGHPHAGQSIEHGKAVLHAAAPPPELQLVLAELVSPELPQRAAAHRAAWFRTEQPQGP